MGGACMGQTVAIMKPVDPLPVQIGQRRSVLHHLHLPQGNGVKKNGDRQTGNTYQKKRLEHWD